MDYEEEDGQVGILEERRSLMGLVLCFVYV